MNNHTKSVFPQPTIGNSEPGNKFDKKKYKFVKLIAPGDMLQRGQDIVFHFKRGGIEALSTPRIKVESSQQQLSYKFPSNKVPDDTFSITYTVYDEGENVGNSLELNEEFFTGSFQNIDYTLSDNAFMKQWGGFNFYNSDPAYRELAASGGAFAIRSAKTQHLIVAGDANYGGVVPDALNRLIEYYEVKNTYSTQTDLGVVITLDNGTTRFLCWGQNIPANYDFVKYMSNVTAVYANQFAFVAMHDTLIDNMYWLTAVGRADSGGVIPDSIHLKLVMDKPVAVYATYRAFAVLTESGKVYSWGQDNFGGNINQNVRDFLNHHDMQYLCTTSQAFCAYNDDGDVIAWGDKDHGGDIPANVLSEIADHDGVFAIVAANAAFCAITNTRRKAYAWGNAANGGNISGNALDVASRGNIVLCRATNTSFSIISQSGDVGCWGAIGQAPGGLYQQSFISEEVVIGIKSYMSTLSFLPPISRSFASVKATTGEEITLLSNDGAFVFISRDQGLNTKNVKAWGDNGFGGTLSGDVSQTLMAAKIVQMTSTNGAFGCLLDAGSAKGLVVVWGRSLSQYDAGSLPTDPTLANLLNNGVVCLYSLKMLPPTVPAPPQHVDPAMAAVLEDGTYVLWGGRIIGSAIHV